MGKGVKNFSKKWVLGVQVPTVLIEKLPFALEQAIVKMVR
jgi:hypothetical protein